MKSNPLKYIYENFWVPVFGRILLLFSSWIEGKEAAPKDGKEFEVKKY